MTNIQNTGREKVFHQGDLVILHDHDGKHATPIPAVVVRQEPDGVVLKARVQGIIKELIVDPEQLDDR